MLPQVFQLLVMLPGLVYPVCLNVHIPTETSLQTTPRSTFWRQKHAAPEDPRRQTRPLWAPPWCPLPFLGHEFRSFHLPTHYQFFLQVFSEPK